METTKQPSPDFLDLWKLSAPPPIEGTKNHGGEKTVLSESSYLWTNLSQMAPSDRAAIMSKLTALWPYGTERRALNWPMHAGLLTNCLTAALISTRINADMVVLKPKMPFLEAIRTCPKAPFVFGVYSSGICFYVLQQTVINPQIFREDEPCSSCLVSKSVAIGIVTGIVIPMISTPYLCHYVLMHRQGERFPEIKNMLEFLMLSIEGSRASRSLLAPLLILQAAVAAGSVYSVLWARKRVFGTMDADPELAKELLVDVQSKPSTKERVVDYLKKIPLLGGVVAPTAPENEQY